MPYTPQTRDEWMTNQRSIIGSQYGQARSRLQEEQSAQMPQYQQARDQADVGATQRTQGLRELMAQRGLYRSGSAVGQEAGIYNQAAQQRADITRDQSLYGQQMSNRLAELGQGEAADMSRAAIGYEEYGQRAEQLRQAAGGLTGQYGGASTLAAQQLAQQGTQFGQQLGQQERGMGMDEAYRRAQLAQQGTQFGQQLTQSGTQFGQQMDANLLNMLMNYNLGVGQQTRALPQPNQFTYGDQMVQLLRRLGY